MYKGTDSKYNPSLPTQINENPNYDIIAKQPTNSPTQTKQETLGRETINTQHSLTLTKLETRNFDKRCSNDSLQPWNCQSINIQGGFN